MNIRKFFSVYINCLHLQSVPPFHTIFTWTFWGRISFWAESAWYPGLLQEPSDWWPFEEVKVLPDLSHTKNPLSLISRPIVETCWLLAAICILVECCRSVDSSCPSIDTLYSSFSPALKQSVLSTLVASGPSFECWSDYRVKSSNLLLEIEHMSRTYMDCAHHLILVSGLHCSMPRL